MKIRRCSACMSTRKYLGWMLLAPALALLAGARLAGSLVVPADPDGWRAFRELSRELRAHPDQDEFMVTRIVETDPVARALGDVEARGGDFKVMYSRRERILREGNGNGWTQRWERVPPRVIHAVAAANGTFPDLARHGALNAPL